MPFRSSDPPLRREKSYVPFSGGRRDRLMDDAFERYLAWRSESALLEAAFRTWLQAPRSDAPIAFAAYGAALDREECAAVEYRAALAAVDDLLVRAA